MKCSCKDVTKCEHVKVKTADLEKKKVSEELEKEPKAMDKKKTEKSEKSVYDVQKSYKLMRAEEESDKENPDKEEDAKLGEEVEELVEQHMKDNKEAEEKEGHEITFKNDLVPGMSFKDLKKKEEKMGTKPGKFDAPKYENPVQDKHPDMGQTHPTGYGKAQIKKPAVHPTTAPSSGIAAPKIKKSIEEKFDALKKSSSNHSFDVLIRTLEKIATLKKS